MAKDAKELIRELVEEVLDEMSTTGGVQGYMTPHAFRGKKDKDAVAARSMPGGKVVKTKHDESDDTTITEDDTLPIQRRTLAAEGRYYNFKNDESMKSRAKLNYALGEAAKMLREIDFLMDLSAKLKNEEGFDKTAFYSRTMKQLREINKRTKSVARKAYRMGKR